MVRRGRTKSRTVRVQLPQARIWPLETFQEGKDTMVLGIMRITKDIDQIQVKGNRVRFQHQPRVFYFPSFSFLI